MGHEGKSGKYGVPWESPGGLGCCVKQKENIEAEQHDFRVLQNNSKCAREEENKYTWRQPWSWKASPWYLAGESHTEFGHKSLGMGPE